MSLAVAGWKLLASSMASIADFQDDTAPAAHNEPRVLLVEDDRLLARAVTRTLRAHNLQVTLALTAADLAQLEGQYDIGIFDIDLPDADGIELAHLSLATGLVGQIVFFSATESQRKLTAAAQLGELVAKGDGLGPLVERVLLACRRPSGVYSKPVSG